MDTLEMALSRLSESALMQYGKDILAAEPDMDRERVSRVVFGLTSTFGFGDCLTFAAAVSERSGHPIMGIVSDRIRDADPSNLAHAFVFEQESGLGVDVFGKFSPGALFGKIEEIKGRCEIGAIDPSVAGSCPPEQSELLGRVLSGLPWLGRWFGEPPAPLDWLSDAEEYFRCFGNAPISQKEVIMSVGS
jgi:hypothetical protein